MSVFKCKMCGGTLEINEDQTTAVCEYCGTQQTLPKLGDDRRAQMYDRANHFRRNNEFDKALGICEKILNDDSTDAEAYWSIVLCRYGIEYVEDPTTHKRVPTVNRAQFTSIFDDEDYKSALRNADGYQKSIYEEEAYTINEIQKGILAISQREEAFDVFICYKETDSNGRRTQDSVLANDLYHHLTQEGFKVFFSRITLEDKLGTAYEPYIFAALNSAKVMVVIGTKPEYFNAVWVKNEWSRYLALIKNGAKKILIPAYRDMDPYDLPEEFSHLQAQDMSKLGFMQDLIRGIKKLTEDNVGKATAKETGVTNSISDSGVDPLLKRAFMFLEDGDFARADEFCEQVLNRDPENPLAYLGKVMAELKVCKKEELKNQVEPFEDNINYRKAVRFADESFRQELEEITLAVKYMSAVEKMKASKTQSQFEAAADEFRKISGYKDSEEQIAVCLEKAELARKNAILAKENVRKTAILQEARRLFNEDEISSLKKAVLLCESIDDWSTANAYAESCRKRINEIEMELQRKAEQERIKVKKRKSQAIILTSIAVVVSVFLIVLYTVIIPIRKYNDAVELMDSGKYDKAIATFTALNGFRDAKEQIQQIQLACYAQGQESLNNNEYIEALFNFSLADDYKDSANKVKEISKIVRELNANTISAGGTHTVGLKSDGKVVATEYKGDFLLYQGQCNVGRWSDIVAVAAGDEHTVGLKSDGTVVATDYERYSSYDYGGQCDVDGWSDIIAVAAGDKHTVGLKSDGTVIAAGDDYHNECDVDGWSNIVAVSAGTDHTVGLKSDGTVVATQYVDVDYEVYHGECDVEDWSDVVAVSAGKYYTVGLKSSGTVVATKYTGNPTVYDGQCDVRFWSDIKLPKE